MENDYQVLGVSPDASGEEIRKRYRFLVKAYHPDRFVNPAEKILAGEEMIRINHAYAILSDPQKRRDYDHLRGDGHPRDQEKTHPENHKNGSFQTETPRPVEKDQVKTPHRTICQGCSSLKPTEPLAFHQTIGLVLLRFHRKMEGNLCAECAEAYFWKYTALNLLFGWWGIVSFFITPVFLLMNLYNYLKSWKLRRDSQLLSSIAIGWKVAAVMASSAIVIVFQLQFAAPMDTDARVKPAQAVKYYSLPMSLVPGPTRISRSLFAPTPMPAAYRVSQANTGSDCSLWSEITVQDRDKYRCVYGFVRDAYFVGDWYEMRFGAGINDFRMILLNNAYIDGVKGNCVMAMGVIKTYNQVPYLEVENLYQCK